MTDKPKRKVKPTAMSRRQFLTLGVASSAVVAGAGLLWQRQSAIQDAVPDIVNCAYSWAANELHLNDASSEVLQEALIAEGLLPIQADVYDRAMEYSICYDGDGNEVSRDLLYRHGDSATVVFDTSQYALTESTHSDLVQAVFDTITQNNLTIGNLEVRLMDGDDALVWSASVSGAQFTDYDLYQFGYQLSR